MATPRHKLKWLQRNSWPRIAFLNKQSQFVTGGYLNPPPTSLQPQWIYVQSRHRSHVPVSAHTSPARPCSRFQLHQRRAKLRVPAEAQWLRKHLGWWSKCHQLWTSKSPGPSRDLRLREVRGRLKFHLVKIWMSAMIILPFQGWKGV